MADTVLETTGLSRVFRQGERPVQALHDFDLRVQAGEFIVVLGPSGSGKSTLLNLLGLMDRPTSGEIRLFDRRTTELSEDDRAAMRCRRIGFVFQFDSLLSEFTVLENVTLPSRIAQQPRQEEKARALLGQLGIGGLHDRFPHQLSGGERQRAAIARALINSPAVLLADEPTGNLDKQNGETVCAKLKELAESTGVAVIMVTHNEHAAAAATRIIRLADGRLE
ncbi:MAG: ABC transporter ATP-binding protein [Elusimicrobiota bacterium]